MGSPKVVSFTTYKLKLLCKCKLYKRLLFTRFIPRKQNSFSLYFCRGNLFLALVLAQTLTQTSTTPVITKAKLLQYRFRYLHFEFCSILCSVSYTNPGSVLEKAHASHGIGCITGCDDHQHRRRQTRERGTNSLFLPRTNVIFLILYQRAAVLSEASMVNKIEYRVECQILSSLHR